LFVHFIDLMTDCIAFCHPGLVCHPELVSGPLLHGHNLFGGMPKRVRHDKTPEHDCRPELVCHPELVSGSLLHGHNLSFGMPKQVRHDKIQYQFLPDKRSITNY